MYLYTYMYMYKRVPIGNIELRQECNTLEKQSAVAEGKTQSPIFLILPSFMYNMCQNLATAMLWKQADHYSIKSRHTVIHNETQSKYICKWYLLLTMELH